MAEGGAAVQQARLQPRHLSGGLRQVGVQRPLCLDSAFVTMCFKGGEGGLQRVLRHGDLQREVRGGADKR